MIKKFLFVLLLVGSTVALGLLGNIYPIFNIFFWILFGLQLFAIVSWFLIGVYNVIRRDMIGHRDYVIFKNWHITLFKIPSIFLYFNNHKLIQRQFIFNDTSKYDLQEQGINKLFGLSFGIHHDNSVRFGWKYKKETNYLPNLTYPEKVEIYSYIYKNKERFSEKIAEVNLDQLNTYYIEYYVANKSNLMINMWVRTNVDIAEGNTNYRKYTYMIPNTLPKWGYSLFPYFGGKFKAPHKIKIREIFY